MPDPEIDMRVIDAHASAIILTVAMDGTADLIAHVPPATVLRSLRAYTDAFAAKHGLEDCDA